MRGPAPRPAKRSPVLAKSRDVSLGVRASHKSDEEVLRKLDHAPRKMVRGLGGIPSAKGSVLLKPGHSESWGAVASEAKECGRGLTRSVVYRNEAAARGMLDSLSKPTHGEVAQMFVEEFTYGSGRGFGKGMLSPPCDPSNSTPQPDLSAFTKRKRS